MKNKIFLLFSLFIVNLSFVLATAGVSYDLTASTNDITGGSQINVVFADEKHNIVYIGTSDNKFGYYNESSNSTVVLTSIMNVWTFNEYFGITSDDDKNLIYVTTSQDPQWFGYYNLTSNTSAFINNFWTYATRIILDKDRNVIWYISNDGDLGYINLTDMSKVAKAAPGGAVYTAFCWDTQDDRLYVGAIFDTRTPFYYSIANDSIVELSALQTNIYSCDIRYDIEHQIFFGTSADFSYSSMYIPETDENKVIVYTGDLNNFPNVQYMQSTKTVAMAEVSVFDEGNAGRIYNISSNTTTLIRDGDVEDWMGTSYMYLGGDYMNSSRRYYIGFTDGKFGYYDNNFTPVCIEDWQPYYTACQENDTKYLYYVDNGNCSTYQYLPGNNGSSSFCSYVGGLLTQIIDDINELNLCCNSTAKRVWNYSTRNLTYYPPASIDYEEAATWVWNDTTRTLTNLSNVDVDIGNAVWSSGNYTINVGLLTQIIVGVWEYVGRYTHGVIS